MIQHHYSTLKYQNALLCSIRCSDLNFAQHLLPVNKIIQISGN